MPESLKAIDATATSAHETAPDNELAFRSEHDILWDTLGPDDAPLVRQALAKAQELRAKKADPGYAYLQGFASSLALTNSIRAIPEQPGEDSRTSAA